MRLWLTLATAGMAVAGANAMGSARLTAQETPAELTGCYDVTVGQWVVETYAGGLEPRPGELGDYRGERIPQRMRFAAPEDGGPIKMSIVAPEGGLPVPRRIMSAEVDGDSLRLAFSTGFSGMTATLRRSGDGWSGTAQSFTDVIPHQVNARTVLLNRVDCGDPLPAPIEHPGPLPRVVQLEGGPLITVGEPLPEQLATVDLPPFEWYWTFVTDQGVSGQPFTTPRNAVSVVGRTRGLFGASDSIQVHTDPDGLVYSIRLLYANPGARDILAERLRSQYGAPGTRSGVPDVHIYRSASTSLWLRPLPRARAEVRLSDRGR